MAFNERFSEGVDAFTTGVPRLFPGIDLDSMIDEPSTNGAFHFVDTAVKSLSIFDQGSELAVRFGGHVNRFELIYRSHARELEGIVFVGFAFDVTPLPSVFVGGADESFQAVADRQVVDPA